MIDVSSTTFHTVRLSAAELNLIVDALLNLEAMLRDADDRGDEVVGAHEYDRDALQGLADRLDALINTDFIADKIN